MDTLILSRMQFAVNISFHILFPTITIALCWFLLFFRVRFMQTKDSAWDEAHYFWTKVFALTFALGVVSGIVMSFQFGTNWPGFMQKTGNIAGPLLGYEVLTAFFLEATFLGIMLFGRGRVSERIHLAATALVAFGTTMSAFWILALNSWMQTPAGYEIVLGQFHVKSWFDVVFNPSFPYRFSHVLLASTLTASFFIAGLSAWQLIKGSSTAGTHKAMRTAIIAAAIAIPLQFVVGDAHGLSTRKHQPAKIAAIEAIWQTEKGAALTLLGWPDEKQGKTLYAVQVPKLGSLILAHDANAEIQGLDAFEGAHPPVAPVFWGFRVMVGIGSLMLLVAWASAWMLWHRRGDVATLPRTLLCGLSAMSLSGWLATLAGWYVTEIGRQPYIVYGLVKTSEVATHIAPTNVAITLSAYVLVYGLLLVTYVGVLKYMAENPVSHAPLAPRVKFPTAKEAI